MGGGVKRRREERGDERREGVRRDERRKEMRQEGWERTEGRMRGG